MVTAPAAPLLKAPCEWADVVALAGEPASTIPADVFAWLSFVRTRLLRVRSPRIVFAGAYGSAFLPPREGKRRRPWSGEGYLALIVVTADPDPWRARVKLAERVFGPVFSEFGHLPFFEVWSVERMRAELAHSTKQAHALQRSVVLLDRRQEMSA
jgi:hypothetical protein